MGTTQSSIARIEGGCSLPTLGMLARLAHATGTPLRLAAPGLTDVDLRRSRLTRSTRPGCRPRMSQHVPRFRHQPTGAVAGCRRFPMDVRRGKKETREGEGRRKEDTGTLSDSHARGRVVGSVSPWPTGQILMKRRMPERLMWNS